jgi:hypothetical protein
MFHPPRVNDVWGQDCPIKGTHLRPAGDQGSQEGAAAQGESHGGDGGLAGAAKKVESLLFEGRGKLTSAAHRQKAIELISEAHAVGADLVRLAARSGSLFVFCLIRLVSSQ